MKRLFWQGLLLGGMIAAMLFGLRAGRWRPAAAPSPLSPGAWQQGLRPLRAQLAAAAAARADETEGSDRPFLVAVGMDFSAVPGYRFAAPVEADLAGALTRGERAGRRIEALPSSEAGRADLSVILVLRSYTRGEEMDELAGTIRYATPDGAVDEETFTARCPAPGRDWFVQPAPRMDLRMAIPAILLLLFAPLGSYYAYQTFAGKYDHSGRMGILALLSLGALAAALLALAEPGRGRFSIPGRRVRIVLDTSDAVRFPVVPGAERPLAGAAGMNDLCRFVALSVDRIAAAADEFSAPGGFRAWLIRVLESFGDAEVRSGLGEGGEELEILHTLPAAGDDPSWDAAPRAAPAELARLLRGGHRTRGTGFFLPWEGTEPANREELVVAFMTAEPSSRRQAAWLEEQHGILRSRCPEDTRILTVLLPALPRSSHAGWGRADRLRNAAAVSDIVLSTEPPPASGYPSGTGFTGFEAIPLFPAPPAAAPEAPSSDLDEARSRLLRADDARLAAAAERVAEKARGMSEVLDYSVFQASPRLIVLALLPAAALLLFLRLHRELRILHLLAAGGRRPAGRLEWLGALAGLFAALFAAMLCCYLLDAPARWKTSVGPGLVLWGVVLLWFASVWFPVLIGRSLGALPPPKRMLSTRSFAWLYTAAFAGSALLLLLTALAALIAGGGFRPWTAPAIAGIISLPLIILVLGYQYSCFWRDSRRLVFVTGLAGLALLVLLGAVIGDLCPPLTGWCRPLPGAGGPAASRLLLAVLGLAVALPFFGALPGLVRLVRGETHAEDYSTDWSLGWQGLIFAVLGGLILPGLLLWPTSVGARRSLSRVQSSGPARNLPAASSTALNPET